MSHGAANMSAAVTGMRQDAMGEYENGCVAEEIQFSNTRKLDSRKQKKKIVFGDKAAVGRV